MVKKKTSVRLSERRLVDADYLTRKYEDVFGRSRRSLINHIAKKIIAGDYDWIEDYKKEERTTIHIDKDLMDKVGEIAKEKGYGRGSYLIEEVIMKEKVRQTRGKNKEYYEEIFGLIGVNGNDRKDDTTT
ncbi:hypothetical protein [Staphylococcus epidermidis]|uniref:hypothetical protein n=1 Tax=Staphylococcus epidermidis TaxID=1282 RepID=UPI0011A346E6|nr:hypothetical protein [Staphylococcus epidermidis]